MKTIEEIETTVSYITWTEFAEFCRISPRTVRNWRNDPKMSKNLPKSRELGGREVIMVPDLYRWYYEHEEGIKAHKARKEANKRTTSG